MSVQKKFSCYCPFKVIWSCSDAPKKLAKGTSESLHKKQIYEGWSRCNSIRLVSVLFYIWFIGNLCCSTVVHILFLLRDNVQNKATVLKFLKQRSREKWRRLKATITQTFTVKQLAAKTDLVKIIVEIKKISWPSYNSSDALQNRRYITYCSAKELSSKR